MRALFSALLWLFFVASSALLFIGAVAVWLVTWPFDRTGRVLHLYSCFWAQLYFYVNPAWRLRIAGRERLPWRGAAVLVANHASLGDILILFGLYRPFKWVSKASNFRLPFIGWNMSMNRYVPLVRGDKDSIAKMMAESDMWLSRGVPLLLFPEGTRSTDGKIKAFKDGAFKLAIAHGCPVFPIVLSGTSEMIPKHGWVVRERADCRVRVLEPVDPAAFGGDVGALRDHVRTKMLSAKEELDAGGVWGAQDG